MPVAVALVVSVVPPPEDVAVSDEDELDVEEDCDDETEEIDEFDDEFEVEDEVTEPGLPGVPETITDPGLPAAPNDELPSGERGGLDRLQHALPAEDRGELPGGEPGDRDARPEPTCEVADRDPQRSERRDLPGRELRRGSGAPRTGDAGRDQHGDYRYDNPTSHCNRVCVPPSKLSMPP